MLARLLAPHNDLVLKSLAKLQARLGELPAAVDNFRQIVAAEPASPDAHLNLAIALADSGDQKEVLEQATAAEELDPRLAGPHLNRARILDDLHRPEEAKPSSKPRVIWRPPMVMNDFQIIPRLAKLSLLPQNRL